MLPCSALPSPSCALPRKPVTRPAGVPRQPRPEVVVLLRLVTPSSRAEASLALCVGILRKDPLQSWETMLRKSKGQHEQGYVAPYGHSSISVMMQAFQEVFLPCVKA